jgi:5'(3')-deoxyribonucleotidase
MHCKCAECGGKIDCDSIICNDCLAEIINKVNLNSDRSKAKDEVQARKVAQTVQR